MDQNKTAIERAFDLARSGMFDNASEIKKAVGREGYSTAQIDGSVLMKQLREAIRTGKESADIGRT